jgi:hypothetical protein
LAAVKVGLDESVVRHIALQLKQAGARHRRDFGEQDY